MGAQRKRDSFFLTLGTEKARGRELQMALPRAKMDFFPELH